MATYSLWSIVCEVTTPSTAAARLCCVMHHVLQDILQYLSSLLDPSWIENSSSPNMSSTLLYTEPLKDQYCCPTCSTVLPLKTCYRVGYVMFGCKYVEVHLWG